jgi:hypothetical protein
MAHIPAPYAYPMQTVPSAPYQAMSYPRFWQLQPELLVGRPTYITFPAQPAPEAKSVGSETFSIHGQNIFSHAKLENQSQQNGESDQKEGKHESPKSTHAHKRVDLARRGTKRGRGKRLRESVDKSTSEDVKRDPEDRESEEADEVEEDKRENTKRQDKVGKRRKNRQERPIKMIVLLCHIWRTLCSMDKLKDMLKPYPPRKAALMLGARPGTLYDYEKKIKKCIDLGFNFKENKDKCVGTLTEWIKKSTNIPSNKKPKEE